MNWLDEPRSKGTVAVVETDGQKVTDASLRPWQESHTRGSFNDQKLREDINKTEQVVSPFTAEPLKKLTGTERKKEIAKGIFEWACDELRRDPNWRPPASMAERFISLSWREGDPITKDTADRLATVYLEEAKRKLRNDGVPVVGKPSEWAAPRF